MGKSLTPNMLIEFKKQLGNNESLENDALEKLIATNKSRISTDRLTE